MELLWEKIKARYSAWADLVATLWERKFYIRSILILLAMPISCVGALFLFWALISVAFGFLESHFVDIALFVGVPVCFIIWIASRRSERQERLQIEKERQQQRVLKEYEETREATYNTEATMLFAVARELGGLGLIPPMRLSNLFSPCHTLPRADGAVILCQFLIQKAQDNVDLAVIKRTLQTKIDQRLAAGEYPGIERSHTYQGRSYSSFLVTDLVDSEGFIEIYTVLVNDDYCRYSQSRDLRRDAPPRQVDRSDVDY